MSSARREYTKNSSFPVYSGSLVVYDTSIDTPRQMEKQMQTLTPGARAVLELDLQEVRRSLSAAMAARASATDMAVENGALADECRAEGKHQLALSYAATSIAWRSRAVVLGAEVAGLMTQEQALVAKLKAAEPVVLTRDASEGMDDMAGLLGALA